MHPAPYSVWWTPQGAAVVTMPDEIDLTNCDQVHEALLRAVESGATVVIADLTGTRFCGYTGAATLVSVHSLAAEAGAQLRVTVGAPKARLIGKIAGAAHRLHLYPNLTAALDGARTRGKTAAGRRLRLIPGGAARSGPGKPIRRLSVVSQASQAPPPRPPATPA
jgi:anti-anti-sigma regulatory factor